MRTMSPQRQNLLRRLLPTTTLPPTIERPDTMVPKKLRLKLAELNLDKMHELLDTYMYPLSTSDLLILCKIGNEVGLVVNLSKGGWHN